MSSNVFGAVGKVDRHALLNRLDGDEELLTELVTLFVDSYGELMAELQEGISKNHPTQVRTAAHALKGSIANFTEGGAFRVARELERLGQAGQLANAEAEFLNLEKELESLQRELKECIQALPLARCE